MVKKAAQLCTFLAGLPIQSCQIFEKALDRAGLLPRDSHFSRLRITAQLNSHRLRPAVELAGADLTGQTIKMAVYCPHRAPHLFAVAVSDPTMQFLPR